MSVDDIIELGLEECMNHRISLQGPQVSMCEKTIFRFVHITDCEPEIR